MLRVGMYVRCPVDDDKVNPRDFAMGQISAINKFSESVTVNYFDISQIRRYHEAPDEKEFSAKIVSHIKIRNGAQVYWNDQYYHVKTSVYNKDEGWFYYYILGEDDQVEYCCENELLANFTDGYVAPIAQLRNYEFQNPTWFKGRWVVSNAMQSITNSLYGFKELAGCKIDLKPYQLKAVMRCLQEKPCRMMLADEVGMGKTIEALCVLKVYMKEHHNSKILIVVPLALVEQWRTELAFKFRLFEKNDENNNFLTLISTEQLNSIDLLDGYSFVIVDEVHRLIQNSHLYNRLLTLSSYAENILFLSATPIQKRAGEYQKLLTLIHPKKYQAMDETDFAERLDRQAKIIRQVYFVMSELDTLTEEISKNKGKHCDDTEDAYDDLDDELSRLKKLVKSDVINDLLDDAEYDDADFGIGKIQTAVSYICENYQLEKSIIRNRRIQLLNEKNERQLIDIAYDLDSQNNELESLTYRQLADWMASQTLTMQSFETTYRRLISAFFSSANAFYSELKAVKRLVEVPEALSSCAAELAKKEKKNARNIADILDAGESSYCRLTNIISFIDEQTGRKKVLLFTDEPQTFQLYKDALCEYFGEEYCCWFQKNMDPDELELNAYRFQNNAQYKIMLSDETGGEGRNFQNADYVIHIDLPWKANTIEQRIGRLDRIGRETGRPVFSVVAYARNSIEESLFKIWKQGVGLFTQSQSGLEIIMNDVDQKIMDALSNDFKYGLDAVYPEIVSLVQSMIEEVKKESQFDFTTYQYREINHVLTRTLNTYKQSETSMFANSMLGWAALSGFNGEEIHDQEIRFNENAFSSRSASNTMFIPPDMVAVINDRINQLQNKIRVMNNERASYETMRYIQGTFSRSNSINNDYIHFFAPGDEIFDSITDNALSSYRGTSAAVITLANFNWTGIVFTWKVEPDYAGILNAGLQLHMIDQYRGYLPQEQLLSAETWNENDSHHSEKEVVQEFRRIMTDSSMSGKAMTHLGQRKGNPLRTFKKEYPPEQWKALVNACLKKAKEQTTKDLKLRLERQLELMQSEMQRSLSAEKASALYFGTEYDEQAMVKRNQIIMNAFMNSQPVLDSVCYIRMVNHD